MPVAERVVRLAKPHPAQLQILSEQRRFNVVALGRRAGKSKLAQRLLAQCALERRPGGYFAPTYKLLEEFWRELKVVLADVVKDKSEQEHRLEVLGGGVIECWSTDTGDPARGRRYALAVLDEAAMVPHLADIWGQAIRPTLTDYQGGAWFMSTPRGLNDFYVLFERGQDPLEPAWMSWQMPTAVNPYIAEAEIASARAELPERVFAQEYLAQFLTIEGAGVFRGVQAVSRLQPQAPARGRQYVFGVDWSAGGGDYTAISVIDVTVNEQVLLDRFSTTDFDLATGRLYSLAELYHPISIVAEQNSFGMPLVQRLQRGWTPVLGKPRRALPVYAFTTTNTTKAAAVQALALAIENGELTLLDDAVQKAELLAYESTVLPSGLIRYAAPSGMHDDTVQALALAWTASLRDTGMTRGGYAFAARR